MATVAWIIITFKPSGWSALCHFVLLRITECNFLSILIGEMMQPHSENARPQIYFLANTTISRSWAYFLNGNKRTLRHFTLGLLTDLAD